MSSGRPRIQTVVLITKDGRKAYFTGPAGQLLPGDSIDRVQITEPVELPAEYSWEPVKGGIDV